MSLLRDNLVNQLEGIALKGGERGPHYDQGVLYVVRQIRETGTVEDSVFAVLETAFHHPGIVTPAEHSEADRILKELGFSPREGAEFAEGVRAAELTLKPYCK